MVRSLAISITDVRTHIKRYALASGLRYINRWSRYVFVKRPRSSPAGAVIEPGLTITQWDLAFLAKELILCSNDFRRANLRQDFKGFRKTLYLIESMRDPSLNEEAEANLDRAYNFLTRTANQQFRHQRWAINSLYRTFWLHERTWRDIPETLNLDDAARFVFGMSTKQFLRLGFVLLAAAASERQDCFTPDYLRRAGKDVPPIVRDILTGENLELVRDKVVVDYRGFRELSAQHRLDPAFARFEFNPLAVRPVIETEASPKVWVVPSITSLLLRFSDGIYHDFFNYYRDRGNHHDYTRHFGRVFERYVGDQLRVHARNGVIIPEHPYQAGRLQKLGPDWVLVEGARAVVVECSISRLVLDAKLMAEPITLRQQVRDKLLEMVRLFPEKIEHLRNDREIWPELASVKQFYPVIVTYDPWLPAKPFQEIIINELARERIDPGPFHLISADELEDVLAFLPTGQTLTELLQDRVDRCAQADFLNVPKSWSERSNSISPPNLLLEQARIELLDAFVPDPNSA